VEPGFLAHFKEFLPRLAAYLAVPFYFGLQMTMIAKEERRIKQGHSAGSYALDAVGLVFSVGVPAFVIVSSLGIFTLGAKYPEPMSALFRYGLMFLFFGMWWQFFGIMALKAYRDRDREIKKRNYFIFYAAGSVFISLTAFFGGEWFLKWMSLAFLALAAPLILLPGRRMCVAFWIAAAVAFIVQTAGFVYVSSII